jgi:hypothetical protein
MNHDNVPRVTIDRAWKLTLIPGLVLQWFIYMNPGKGMRGVAASTRAARSPLMTGVYSAVFWVVALCIGFFWLIQKLLG